MSPSSVSPKLEKKSRTLQTSYKSLTNKPSSSILISCQVAIHMILSSCPYHNPTPSFYRHVTLMLPSNSFISILIFKILPHKIFSQKIKYFYQIIPYRVSFGVTCYVVHFLFVSFELMYQFETWELLKWFCTN